MLSHTSNVKHPPLFLTLEFHVSRVSWGLLEDLSILSVEEVSSHVSSDTCVPSVVPHLPLEAEWFVNRGGHTTPAAAPCIRLQPLTGARRYHLQAPRAER